MLGNKSGRVLPGAQIDTIPVTSRVVIIVIKQEYIEVASIEIIDE